VRAIDEAGSHQNHPQKKQGIVYIQLKINHKYGWQELFYVIEDKYFELKEDKKLHYLHSGKGKLKILLLHGGDKHYQNAEHWREMIPWMAKLGEVFAFDLLGHGKSVPGEKHPEKVSGVEQVQILSKFAEKIKNESDNNAIFLWVGRSYGGYILLSILNKNPQLINAMVLIAPAIYPSQLEKLQNDSLEIPIMLFWAEDDPIIPWYKHKKIIETFKHVRFIRVGKVLERGMEKWMAHTPELVKKGLFKKEFMSFVEEDILKKEKNN